MRNMASSFFYVVNQFFLDLNLASTSKNTRRSHASDGGGRGLKPSVIDLKRQGNCGKPKINSLTSFVLMTFKKRF